MKRMGSLMRRSPPLDVLIFAAGSAALVVLGATAPWIRVGYGSSSSGLDEGDGVYTLLIGVSVSVAILAALLRRLTAIPLYAVLLGAGWVVCGAALVNLDQIQNSRQSGVDLSAKEGLYLTLLGGVGLVTAAIAGLATPVKLPLPTGLESPSKWATSANSGGKRPKESSRCDKQRMR